VAHDPVMEMTFPPTVLVDMLAALVTHGVQAVHIHGFLNHDPRLFPALSALEVPIAVTLHDFAAICPRATLTDGTGRYCGEPALAACEACVASNGAHAAIDQFRERFGTVAGWRAHTRAILASAAHVLAPSADCAHPSAATDRDRGSRRAGASPPFRASPAEAWRPAASRNFGSDKCPQGFCPVEITGGKRGAAPARDRFRSRRPHHRRRRAQRARRRAYRNLDQRSIPASRCGPATGGGSASA
jgi:hypothetical protein